MEKFLIAAGGRITCLRCTARSKRSGEQCLKPALKVSRTQKCGHHGGRGNSAPKTEAGRSRLATAHTKTGLYTKVAKLEMSKSLARLAQLEDAMHVLGMTTAPKTRGRKPVEYAPVKSIADVIQLLLDIKVNTYKGSPVG